MLIDSDSTILYSKRVEEHQMGVCLFMRSDDGLCVRLELQGREFFKQIPILSPHDDYHEGVYVAITDIKTEVDQAIKYFTGITYDTPYVLESITFQLLHGLKFGTISSNKLKK